MNYSDTGKDLSRWVMFSEFGNIHVEQEVVVRPFGTKNRVTTFRRERVSIHKDQLSLLRFSSWTEVKMGSAIAGPFINQDVAETVLKAHGWRCAWTPTDRLKRARRELEDAESQEGLL